MDQGELDKINALREFAIQRSCNAASAANENSRPMAQSALLINGGAASALLAFLTKDHIEPILFIAVPWAIGSYAIGVACACVAMYCMTESLDYWNCYWELIATNQDQSEIDAQERSANRSWWPVRIFFGLSILSFGVGSLIFAHAIWLIPASVPLIAGPG